MSAAAEHGLVFAEDTVLTPSADLIDLIARSRAAAAAKRGGSDAGLEDVAAE